MSRHLKALYMCQRIKIEILTFSDVFDIFLAQENGNICILATYITEFILNNAHHTQNDHLAALLQSNI